MRVADVAFSMCIGTAAVIALEYATRVAAVLTAVVSAVAVATVLWKLAWP